MPEIHERVIIFFVKKMIEVSTPTLVFTCPRCNYKDKALQGDLGANGIISGVYKFVCPFCDLSVEVIGTGGDAILEAYW